MNSVTFPAVPVTETRITTAMFYSGWVVLVASSLFFSGYWFWQLGIPSGHLSAWTLTLSGLALEVLKLASLRAMVLHSQTGLPAQARADFRVWLVLSGLSLLAVLSYWSLTVEQGESVRAQGMYMAQNAQVRLEAANEALAANPPAGLDGAALQARIDANQASMDGILAADVSNSRGAAVTLGEYTDCSGDYGGWYARYCGDYRRLAEENSALAGRIRGAENTAQERAKAQQKRELALTDLQHAMGAEAAIYPVYRWLADIVTGLLGILAAAVNLVFGLKLSPVVSAITMRQAVGVFLVAAFELFGSWAHKRGVELRRLLAGHRPKPKWLQEFEQAQETVKQFRAAVAEQPLTLERTAGAPPGK